MEYRPLFATRQPPYYEILRICKMKDLVIGVTNRKSFAIFGNHNSHSINAGTLSQNWTFQNPRRRFWHCCYNWRHYRDGNAKETGTQCRSTWRTLAYYDIMGSGKSVCFFGDCVYDRVRHVHSKSRGVVRICATGILKLCCLRRRDQQLAGNLRCPWFWSLHHGRIPGFINSSAGWKRTLCSRFNSFGTFWRSLAWFGPCEYFPKCNACVKRSWIAEFCRCLLSLWKGNFTWSNAINNQ